MNSADTYGYKESLDVLLGGKRCDLDLGTIKLFLYMLESGEGCDIRIRPGRFECWYGWYPSRHVYNESVGPLILSQLLFWLNIDRLDSIASGTISGVGIQTSLHPIERNFVDHRIWIRIIDEEVNIAIRKDEITIENEKWPDKIDYEYKRAKFEIDIQCPHCCSRSREFRELVSGAMVCDNCARSFYHNR